MCTDTTTNMKQEAGRSSSECSRRGSELLVEWPSPLSPPESEQDQKDNGGQIGSFSEHDRDACTSPSSPSGDAGTIASCAAGEHACSITSSENNSGRQQKAQRSVHFSSRVNIQIIPSIEHYSTERIEKIYYTKADLADQRAEYVATAKEMHRRHRRGEDPLQVHEVKLKTRLDQKNQPSIITSTTTRGLEHMSSSRALDLYRQEQRDVIGVVLLAQENDFTPEEIAIIYGHRVRSARRRARGLGSVDAEHAHF